jgi:hypothetical protein
MVSLTAQGLLIVDYKRPETLDISRKLSGRQRINRRRAASCAEFGSIGNYEHERTTPNVCMMVTASAWAWPPPQDGRGPDWIGQR